MPLLLLQLPQPRHRALHQSPTGDVTCWATPICAHLHKGIDLDGSGKQEGKALWCGGSVCPSKRFRAVAARLTFDDRYGTGRMRRPQGGGLDADSHHQEKRCGWLDRSRQIFIITQRLHVLL